MSKLSNRSLFLRFAGVVLFVFVLDALVLLFAPKPFPLTAIIPALVPLLMVPLVILSRTASAKRKS